MLAYLADVSIRSLLLAVPAAIILGILRGRRTAALQHAVWATVVCGMLALFASGRAFPRLPLRILYSADAPALHPVTVADRPIPDQYLFVETLQPSAPAPASSRRRMDWKGVALCAYSVVAFAFLAQFGTGMFFVRKLAATGRAVSYADMNNVYESDSVTVPVTILWLRPRILLPPEWRQWDGEKLCAVLAHEGAHVRRRDALVAALAGVNRSLFWFHPLAWILERKLALLADQACDESCVALLGDRDQYARLLLEMARVVDVSQGRLRRHALTMAAGPHISQRIDAILQEGRTFSLGLTRAAWAVVMLCGIPVLWGAAAVELDRRPPLLRLDMPRWSPPGPPLSATRPVVQITQVQTAQAQSTLPQAPAPPQDKQAEIDAKLDRIIVATALQSTTPVERKEVQDYVEELGKRLDVSGVASTFSAVRVQHTNALHEPSALPGGLILVPVDLLLTANDEAEFAGMLSQAIARGPFRFKSKAGTIPLIFMFVAETSGKPAGSMLPADIIDHWREKELQADAAAVRSMSRAGFDPSALLRYIARVQPPDRRQSPFPARADRIAALQKAIQDIPPAPYSKSDEFYTIQEYVRP